MSLDWSEHPEAREEYLEALARYADIGDGSLGEEFADAADAASDLILLWPDGSPPYRGRRRAPMIRAWHLGKFPYQLIYTVLEGQAMRPIAGQTGLVGVGEDVDPHLSTHTASSRRSSSPSTRSWKR